MTFFLQNVVQNDVEVGMVRFDSSATTLRSVSKMSDATRQQFINAVPTSANGGTSIAAGLYCSPFYQHGLTLIPAWISNHMHIKV